MLDELNLPVDMVVTHSFVAVNPNIMAGPDQAAATP